jgi:hypothetical protein
VIPKGKRVVKCWISSILFTYGLHLSFVRTWSRFGT